MAIGQLETGGAGGRGKAVVQEQRPNIGSRVTREGHARFWERPEVQFLRATRQIEKDRHRRGTAGQPPTAEMLTDSPAPRMRRQVPTLAERPPTVALDRRGHQALKSLATHKTDRNDARGLAHLARTGFFKPVHVKSLPAHAVRSLIIVRKKLVWKTRSGVLPWCSARCGEDRRGIHQW